MIRRTCYLVVLGLAALMCAIAVTIGCGPKERPVDASLSSRPPAVADRTAPAEPYRVLPTGERGMLWGVIVGDSLFVGGGAYAADSPGLRGGGGDDRPVSVWVDLASGAVTPAPELEHGAVPVLPNDAVRAELEIAAGPGTVEASHTWPDGERKGLVSDISWSQTYLYVRDPSGQHPLALAEAASAMDVGKLDHVALFLPALTGVEWANSWAFEDKDDWTDDCVTWPCTHMLLLHRDGTTDLVRLTSAARLPYRASTAHEASPGRFVALTEEYVRPPLPLYRSMGRLAGLRLVALECDAARGVATARVVFSPGDPPDSSASLVAYTYDPSSAVGAYVVLRRLPGEHIGGHLELHVVRLGDVGEAPSDTIVEPTDRDSFTVPDCTFRPVNGSSPLWLAPPGVPQWMRMLSADEVVWITGDGAVRRIPLGSAPEPAKRR